MESWILYKDSHLPPKQRFDPETMKEIMPEGPAIWYGHESFFEGMRQKGWTLLTISLIAGTAYRLGMYINILGQGDNQIVLVKIPPANYPSIGSLTPHEYVGKLKEELTSDLHSAQTLGILGLLYPPRIF
ncbi:hypothetical protein Q1695_010509 [Nippostrongylus brasiliensis]|nr:hypothetical protein Q1695_010509 [Nippostrongylus brasiliensis]